MRLPQVQLLYVLEALSVDSYRRLFPLEKSHSSDLEPHASPGLSECERRNLAICVIVVAMTTSRTMTSLSAEVAACCMYCSVARPQSLPKGVQYTDTLSGVQYTNTVNSRPQFWTAQAGLRQTGLQLTACLESLEMCCKQY